MGRVLLVAVLGIATLKLVVIQSFQAPDLNAASARQLLTEIPLPAERGPILDSAGKPLAFSIEANALVTNPRTIARTHGAGTAEYVTRMASAIGLATGQDPAALQALLTADKGYVVLAKLVDPGVAQAMHDQFPEIALERRESRQYPGGSLAANVIGSATWDATDSPGKLTGRIGLESSQDNLLSGSNGVREVDTAEGSSAEIPGSVRYERPAVPGSTLQLTLDSDLQYTVQRELSAFVAKTGAKDNSSAVVLDVATGKVRALATGTTFDPSNPGASPARPARQRRRDLARTSRVGQQDRHDVGGDRVRRRAAGRRPRRPGQHPGRRPHHQRRLEARAAALHAHRACWRSRRTSARS